MQSSRLLGCGNIGEGAESVSQWMVALGQKAQASQDGRRHVFHRDAWVTMISAALSLAAPDPGALDSRWMNSLPPSTSPTLHCVKMMVHVSARTCTLVAETHEKVGDHERAIEWAQAELADPFGLNSQSCSRAGRTLGRSHAALGQHDLAVAALVAAIDLARDRKIKARSIFFRPDRPEWPRGEPRQVPGARKAEPEA